MQLRISTASPFCRKVLAAIRIRGDDVQVRRLDFVGSTGVAAGVEPVLTTDVGAFVGAFAIVKALEERRVMLLPHGLEQAVEDLDRLLDLYLIEAALHAAAADPGSEASVSALYTVTRSLDLIEDRLRDGRTRLLGESLTYVDVTALIGILEARRVGAHVSEPLRDYVERLCVHPELARLVAEDHRRADDRVSRRVA